MSNFIKNNHSSNNVDHHSSAIKKMFIRHSALLVLVILLLSLAVFTVFNKYREDVQSKYIDGIISELSSYSKFQQDANLSSIEYTIESLSFFATLINNYGHLNQIDNYLDSLSTNMDDLKFEFLSVAEYENDPIYKDSDEKYENLRNGEPTISNIYWSTDTELYCYRADVPVFIDEQLIGVLRSIVDAKNIISSDNYMSSYGYVRETFLIDNNGEMIILSDSDDPQLFTPTVYDIANKYLDDSYEPSSYIPEINRILASESEIGTYRIGSHAGADVYYSLISLKYNDWNLAVVFIADKANEDLNGILNKAIFYSLILVLCILLSGLIFGYYIKKILQFKNEEMQRYKLIEQFSDTFLFDYDPKSDIIRFTPNTKDFFLLHDTYQTGFVENIKKKYIHPADCKSVKEALEGKGSRENYEIRIRLMDVNTSNYFWCKLQFKYIYRRHRLVHVIGKITNIDDQQKHEEYLINLSEKDGLTDLYNKISTESKVTELLKTDKTGFLIMLDIDNFKNINDTYGHQIGDLVLKEISSIIKNSFRQSDILGRVGGDEMLVYTSNMTSRKTIEKKINLFTDLCRQYSSKHEYSYTTSIGIAKFPDDAATYANLFICADKAMYTIKNGSKNSYAFYEDIEKTD